jgi:hypothetical protein
MATSGAEKAFCVLEFDKSKCATHVKRKYGKNPPTRKAIYHWHKKFVATGCLCPEKKSGRPGVSEEDAERVRETFTRSLPSAESLMVPTSKVYEVKTNFQSFSSK